MKLICIFFACLLLLATAAYAGEADVIEVLVTHTGDDTYKFDVTVRHTDEGWEHYANKWDVTAPDETVLGTRILAHPHVDEVTIRAHDLVHGYGGKTMKVVVPGN